MKQSIVLLIIAGMLSCNKPPMEVQAEPQRYWIDEATQSDTIITNVNDQSPVLYYAAKNWQSIAGSNATHGFRFIAIRDADSILVKPLNDLSTNYDGPFLLQMNADKTELRAQNFLDTSASNEVRIYLVIN